MLFETIVEIRTQEQESSLNKKSTSKLFEVYIISTTLSLCFNIIKIGAQRGAFDFYPFALFLYCVQFWIYFDYLF